MTYNSKRTIISMAVGLALLIAYMVYALGKAAPGTDNLQSWAIAMLVFIGIGLVALIIVQVVFHILVAVGIAAKEGEGNVERILDANMVEDERDKLISLKASRAGYICVALGVMLALAVLALGMAALVALHVLLGALAIGSLLDGAASIYLYERGVQHG